MRDPRLSTALRQLTDLGDEPEPPRWSWAIAGLEQTGRIRLPTTAQDVLEVGSGGSVRGRSSRLALVLAKEAPGAAMAVDGRGRLYVPVWLRQAAAESRALLVGTHIDPAVVVVAGVGVLDGIGDLLAGGPR